MGRLVFRNFGGYLAYGSPVFGREDMLSEIMSGIAKYRFQALIGFPGIGKSTVAVEMARISASKYPDGAYFVDVESLRIGLGETALSAQLGDLVAQKCLGSKSDLGKLKEFLRRKSLLIVLDNCDRLALGHRNPCGALISDLLRSCPYLHVIATSRYPFEVGGIKPFQVGPLPTLDYPDAKRASTRLRQHPSPAAQLYLHVAREGQERASSPWTAAQILKAEIACRFVSGVPLCIKMLPSFRKELRLETSDRRPDDVPRLLPESVDSADEQGLSHFLDQISATLTPSEGRLWRRLAIFRASFGRAEAQSVCGDDDLYSSAFEAALSSLAAKSLIEPYGDPSLGRSRLLPFVREYLGRQIDEDGERDRLLERVAQFFVERLSVDLQHLRSQDMAKLLAQFREDYADIEQALQWSQANSRNEILTKLAVTCIPFWWSEGNVKEQKYWLTRVLSFSDLDAESRVDTLNGLGTALQHSNQSELASYFNREQPPTKAEIYTEILRLHTTAIELAANDGYISGLAWSKNRKAATLLDKAAGKEKVQDLTEAIRLLEESEALYRGMARPDIWGIAISELLLGRMCAQLFVHYKNQRARGARQRDHYLERAQRHIRSTIVASRDAGNPHDSAMASRYLGDLELHQKGRDHVENAEVHFATGVEGFAAIDDKICLIRCVEGLAATAAGLGQHHRAVVLASAARKFAESFGNARPPLALSPLEEEVAQLLIDEQFKDGATEGEFLSLDELIARAQQIASRRSVLARQWGLGGRHLEVIEALAKGGGTKELAPTIAMSDTRFDASVHSIIRILIDSGQLREGAKRGDLVQWARENGLI